MIAKYDTSSVGGSKGSSNTIIILGLLLVGGFIAYNYFLKPKTVEQNEQ
jgi:hypothetical protein